MSKIMIMGQSLRNVLLLDNVTRPNAEQITDLVLKLINDYLSWNPPTVVIGENEDMTNISEEERITVKQKSLNKTKLKKNVLMTSQIFQMFFMHFC